MDRKILFENSIKNHAEVFLDLYKNQDSIFKACTMLFECLKTNHKILVCGNGGSAADAQHFVAELVVQFKIKRTPLSALALTTDTSVITAAGNDFGFDYIFADQILALGNEGDTLIGISTSGYSENIRVAIDTANNLNLNIIGLLGNKGGGLQGEVDIPVIVDSNNTARIQEAHEFILHFWAEYLEEKFFKDFV